MKAVQLEDGDYSLTTTESPLLDDQLNVVGWFVGYIEIRNSAMGYPIIDMIRVNVTAPWQTNKNPDDVVEGEYPWDDITIAQLRNGETPDVIVDRLIERGLIS